MSDLNTHNETGDYNKKDNNLSEQTAVDNHDHDDVINEIETTNAEDAEDEGNKHRHTIELKDYEAMSLEALVHELERLVKHEKIQAIKAHVDGIHNAYKIKLQTLIDEKRDEFLAQGGEEKDFYYNAPVAKQFKDIYYDYKKRQVEYYTTLEKNHKENLAVKLQIIEELKSLINVEENINTTYNHFKELQQRWKNAGPIPREAYFNAWNSYQYHVELFYDFLHLNRDLRYLDFKHNLDKKLKIIERAEALANQDNVMHAFRELQDLHKIWKEDLGPVEKEFRDEIWHKFKEATKKINLKRRDYFLSLETGYEQNLTEKLKIIDALKAIISKSKSTHNDWQHGINEVEKLRESFFNIGKVPQKESKSTWSKFKAELNTFNHEKNAFYKTLKNEQFDNLNKKLELIKIAEDNKDNDDFETITPLMVKIQKEWKNIGHVPRKDSDKIWKRFKLACNAYFDKTNAKKEALNEESQEAFTQKEALITELLNLNSITDKTEGLQTIKSFTNRWNAIGRVPNDKKFIDDKFNKAIEQVLNKLEINKNEVEMIKFETKLEQINANTNEDSNEDLIRERAAIRKRMDEIKAQLNQLENNMQFFNKVDEKNALLKDVLKNIQNHKNELELLKSKMIKLKSMH